VSVRRLIPRDLYHLLLTSSWSHLLGLLAVGYLVANTAFALAYLIEPGAIENARPGSFADAFFFSVQTMATIGYGHLTPQTFLANVLVTLETLTGMLALAMTTGLVFAKFSRPTARVLFSQIGNVVVLFGSAEAAWLIARDRTDGSELISRSAIA